MDDRQEVGPAEFSPDRLYRYTLTRTWDPTLRTLMWVGLNPSTADEHALDPTLRRVRGFSKTWGFGGFVMTNLFAFRATKPKDMMAAEDPIGPDNDRWLLEEARKSVVVMAAWGAHGGHLDRDRRVVELLTGIGASLMTLRTTAHGFPGHPLYIKDDTQPIPYHQRVL